MIHIDGRHPETHGRHGVQVPGGLLVTSQGGHEFAKQGEKGHDEKEHQPNINYKETILVL